VDSVKETWPVGWDNHLDILLQKSPTWFKALSSPIHASA